MPSYSHSAASTAPAEEVWKLLYDPARMEEWWTGHEGVEAVESRGEETRFTAFSQFYPGAALPQILRSEQEGSRIAISCSRPSSARWSAISARR